jgi:hypothetical protein
MLAKYDNDYFETSALPDDIREYVREHVIYPLWPQQINKSEIIRRIQTTPDLECLRRLPHITLARWLKTSPSLITRALNNFVNSETEGQLKKPGRPAVLTDAEVNEIVTWIRDRCSSQGGPAIREVKEQVAFIIEKNHKNFTFNNSYFYKLFDRVLSEQFKIAIASPLDKDRYELSYDMVQEHFTKLEALDISQFDPQLILNLDETGFGQSTSGRAKTKKVLIPTNFEGNPVYSTRQESHFISCIATISLAGNVLKPGLITKLQSDEEDAAFASFFSRSIRYTSENAFVTGDIFKDYLRRVVIPYIESTRTKIVSNNKRAIVFFDGAKAHLAEEYRPIALAHNITFYVLPPHSSHLLQPLDQGFFRRLKSQFELMHFTNGFSKITEILEQIMMAIQATTINQTIWRSWFNTGISPIIENGNAVTARLDKERILTASCISKSPNPSITTRRIKITERFGVIAQGSSLSSLMIHCSFCGQIQVPSFIVEEN